ncbi:MAG: hypothetical protein B6D61_11810 [Bacteroidetes bacterium 4484_249]|nr:MAG: hypothetical protein B6D61_11810 [Bacteroidetes bacterium 4484_249]
MFEFLPYLNSKSILLKVSVLLLLIAVSFVLTMVIGLVVAIPIFGTSILENFTNLNDSFDESTISFLKYFQVVNQIGIFILPVLLYAWLENRNVGSYLRINCKLGVIHLMLSVLLIFVSIPVINWMVEINQQMNLPDFMKGIENWMRESEDKTNKLTEIFLNVNTINGLIINLFIIAFLAAVGEELLFRGVVLRLILEGTKSIHLAIILSSVLFSAIHMQFYGFLPRAILGILFGYVFILTDTLWIPIILHFIFNGITVVAAYLFNKGLISTDIDSIGTSNSSMIIIGSFVLMIFFLFLLYRKKLTNPILQ